MSDHILSYRDMMRLDGTTADEILKMSYPVECTVCHSIYDAGKVTVIQRYSDCSTWKTPCCKMLADDRPYTAGPGIIKIDKRDYR